MGSVIHLAIGVPALFAIPSMDLGGVGSASVQHTAPV